MYGKEYEQILTEIKYILSEDDYDITILSNASALLNEHMTDINWVGFYLLKKDTLILGPFQGLKACTLIKVGRGVCGKTIEENKTIVVPDVHEFPGHIACDSRSNSEICVPLYINNKCIGLLDIDSPIKERFTEVDKEYLEEIVKIIEEKLTSSKRFMEA